MFIFFKKSIESSVYTNYTFSKDLRRYFIELRMISSLDLGIPGNCVLDMLVRFACACTSLGSIIDSMVRIGSYFGTLFYTFLLVCSALTWISNLVKFIELASTSFQL